MLLSWEYTQASENQYIYWNLVICSSLIITMSFTETSDVLVK